MTSDEELELQDLQEETCKAVEVIAPNPPRRDLSKLEELLAAKFSLRSCPFCGVGPKVQTAPTSIAIVCPPCGYQLTSESAPKKIVLKEKRWQWLVERWNTRS